MTQAAMGSGFQGWSRRYQAQIIATLFGMLLLGIALLVLYLHSRYVLSWSDPRLEPQLDRWQLVVTRYSVALIMLSAYLLTIGCLFLFTHCRVSLLNVLLVAIGAGASICMAHRYMGSTPEVVPLPTVVVFWLIARSDTPGCVILLTMLGTVFMIFAMIGADLRLNRYPSVDLFHHQRRDYYLLNWTGADVGFADDRVHAYTCENLTCTLVYPCESAESGCLEEAVVREAWKRQ